MASAGRRCTVAASAMLVAMAFGTAPGPAHPQDTAGAMAREWERRSEEAQRSLRIQAEQHLRMEQEAAHAQMPDTMYASTPDPSPPPHPFPLDARVTSAPERPPAPVAARSATRLGHRVGLFPSASRRASEKGYQGFVRIINRSDAAGEVRIDAWDDDGTHRGPVTLALEALETRHFNSRDLEEGNAGKGLDGETGSGEGDWRLEFTSPLEVEVLGYIRTWDGFLTAMHDVAPATEAGHRVVTFNPGHNAEQASRVRVVNPGAEVAEVRIEGVDDAGVSSQGAVAFALAPGAARTLTARALESGGEGFTGALGTGAGKWRLLVTSQRPIEVMSLLRSATGHLTNLSSVPDSTGSGADGAGGAYSVALFPSASDPQGRQGFVRVVNRTGEAGEVRIDAWDDAGNHRGPVALHIGAHRTVHFNSGDLEEGNAKKGLWPGIGAGAGDWRLELTSALALEVLAYIRTEDGFLTAVHDVAPRGESGHRVVTFNPGRNDRQASRLRVVNPGTETAAVRIEGTDDEGRSSAGAVEFSVPAGAARTLGAAELESGGEGVTGALGTGTGKWRLRVSAQPPVEVMSLLASPSGHLTNLSTVRGRVALGVEETAAEVFAEHISGPIVQGRCIGCHVDGGLAGPGASRLQFVPSTAPGHEAHNLRVLDNFLGQEGVDASYILDKMQGALGHGGGVQFAAGTPEFAAMERFLALLGEDVAPVTLTPQTLFDTVRMAPLRKTLRRAALIFAGRIPTEEEYAAVQRGGAAARETIRRLMTGPEFHEFLIRASNDRLLTDRERRTLNEGSERFVDFVNERYRRRKAAYLGGTDRHWRHYFEWLDSVQYGVGRAPLELIAHVVENDLPYTEILTADYIMANPWAARAYRAPTRFDDPEDVHEFQPSRIVGYYRTGDGFEIDNDRVVGTVRVLDSGPLITHYPHAGILNTTVFLLRYPTTATNRNRARARWTYYHFLGLDIEKSASRTTDPDALADTNNPTMHNPACTVCHTVMDPVAGAFQNYGDAGLYRDQWGGEDSLDGFYKYEPSGREDVPVRSRSRGRAETVLGARRLLAGRRNELGLKNLRTFEGDRKLHIGLGEVVVRDANGDVVDRYETRDAAAEEDCGDRRNEGYILWDCGELLVLPLTVPRDGTYRIGVQAWVYEPGEKAATLQVWMPGPFYRRGDTWYRGMRAPGFGNARAPDPDNSVQWLAEQIVADKRFAEATVKFWWPAIMGSQVAEPPADESDADFEGLLLAANAQGAEVTRLANGFRRGFRGRSAYNLKDLLVEMVLSKWFRADAVIDADPVRLVALRDAGARRLLTPEELNRKTAAVTGHQWSRAPRITDAFRGQRGRLIDEYRLLYGGVDSDGVTERSRDLTAVMTGVAERHAAVVSCPVVMRDFFLVPDAERRLFAGIDKWVIPGLELEAWFDIEAGSRSERETLSVKGSLTAGPKTVTLSYTNDLWDPPNLNRDVRLDRLDVRDATGRVVASRELETLDAVGNCNRPVHDHYGLHCEGSLSVPIEIPAAGDYAIEVVGWADHAGDELPRLRVAVESPDPEGVGVSARTIRSKLVELFEALLGVRLTPYAPDVEAAYQLFVEVMEHGRASGDDRFEWWMCDDLSDLHYFEGILEDAVVEYENEDGRRWYDFNRERVRVFLDGIDWLDPHHGAQAWVVVLAYLLTDYRYLYL